MLTQIMEDARKMVVRAFHKRDKEAVLKLLPELCQPQSVRDEDNILKPTLVHLAVRKGWNDVCRVLVERYSCDPSTTDDFNQSPLHWACHSGRLSVVRFLMSLETVQRSINAQDGFGNTPLHVACDRTHLSVIEALLLEPSTIITLKNNSGRTPIECLTKFSYAILSLFASKGMDWKTELSVRPYFSVFMLGNSGAGKSSLTAVLAELTRRKPSQHGKVSGIKSFTAGISPTRCSG